jgi:hypothetical protein
MPRLAGHIFATMDTNDIPTVMMSHGKPFPPLLSSHGIYRPFSDQRVQTPPNSVSPVPSPSSTLPKHFASSRNAYSDTL